jgi:hypothetical protein
MKKICYLLIVLVTISCANPPDEDSVPYIPNLGEYTPVSIISDIPIDANFDGEYSNDFMGEFKKAGEHYYNMKLFYTNSSELIINTPHPVTIKEVVYAGISIPRMSKPSPNQPTDYTVTIGSGMGVYIYLKDNSIIETEPLLDRDGKPTDSKIIDFSIIDDDNIILKIFHEQIYDENTKEWKSITLEALYTKI